LMKSDAFLINTSRGAVIAEPDLIHCLQSARIAGAGLDVFETEPLPADSPLADLPNVILTHHTAWYSEDSIADLQRKGAEQLVSILKGQIPEFAV
jgi:D-3-phosphoglycerate dehydrogenase / 2-oxoglutarate reductase